MFPSNEEKFKEIYQSHVGSISGFALRRVKPEVAADIVAETFLVVWRKIDNIPPQDEVLPWLFQVARNLISNHRRSAYRSGRLSKKLRNNFVLAAPPAESQAFSGDIHKAMINMKVNDREVLQLSVWEDLKPKDIALVLGETDEAIRVRLHRARKRFRDELKKLGCNDLLDPEVSTVSGQSGLLKENVRYE